MALILRRLTLDDKDAFFAGLDLFSDMNPGVYSLVYKEGMSYEEHLQILDDRSKGINLKEGRVPDSMLYAFLDGKIIGRSSIRHKLNDYLLKLGGNIGYTVASKYRRSTQGAEILRQSLVFCKEELNLSRVLVTCDANNMISYKAIEKQGGILENMNISPITGEYIRRYWIKL